MDGYGDAGTQQRERTGGPLGIEMSLPHAGSPAPHGEEGHVEERPQLRHPVEEVGVTREVHTGASRHHVADRAGGRPEWLSASVVTGRERQ